MKKMLALLLAAVLLFCSCTALAESEKSMVVYDEGLSFAFVYPEGYTAETYVEDGVMFSTIISADETAINMQLLVAPDSELDETATINDLSDEQKTNFANGLMEDLSDPTWSVMTTGYGTEVIVINEQGAAYDLVTITGLYNGYVLELYLGHNDGSEVTDDDIATGLQFFTDMDFVVTVQ